MNNSQDIRWQQRFANYKKALAKLDQAVIRIKANYYRHDVFQEELFAEEDELIKEGLIQRFEYTHELAWNVMKDFLMERGTTPIYGSRDATRAAFATGLIKNGEAWMAMIASRNKTSHTYTYNQATADEIFIDILELYHPEFLNFQYVMEQNRTGTQTSLF
ncbi:nucleotidyltransferase substrate binding protein [Spirosoma sordidisoli]|uniref:Nucleotidyltransferase n=2 Tax=Spirosoma TaxID=107 RepID=A0A4Q2UMU1_9BACT|nr:nucleotidyltransferase substrate binding protein [Spirosoma sordidisoli]RYC69061.1 nucleotidyltransferase [Spirosoma sordidisoli]